MHEGHRGRMYEKLFNNPDSLCEHEILEILLFSILPRVNTNELAHEILSRFGSIDAALHASPEALQNIKGVGKSTASFLVTVGAVFSRLNDKREDIPKIFNAAEFGQYIKQRYKALNREVFDIYLIDKSNNMLGSYRISSDLTDRVTIDPKELTGVISSSKAYAVILVHNHLDGSPEPSAADDDLTKQCQVICSICNIRLYDHFIYSDKWIYSYYANGRMNHILNDYNIHHIMERSKP